MPAFTGTLNSNEIFGAIYNMIISQEVFADNVANNYGALVDMARVDGSLFGDTKLYYSTDVLKSYPWGVDSTTSKVNAKGIAAEALNLLATDYPESPECLSITLNVFRQIRLTVDDYLSKRAWSTEGAFSSFNSIMLGWIRETKKIYDITTYNSFIGTDVSTIGQQSLTVELGAAATTEEGRRVEAQTIATFMANLLTDLKDFSRDYNDYGNLRSYNPDELVFLWNAEWVNEITKMDVPTIFHKDGLIEKFGQQTLPARYFGKVNTAGGTVSAGTTIRALVEKDYTVSSVVTHVFPGDALPEGATYLANETYTPDSNIIFKVFHRRSVPFMSAFEVGTSFFNPRSLTTNHYLTWGRNTLEHLKNYPMITVTAERS